MSCKWLRANSKERGAGRYPMGYGKGRITCTGKITLYHEEVVTIQQQAPSGRLQDIAPFNIAVNYLPAQGLPVTDKLATAFSRRTGATGQRATLARRLTSTSLCRTSNGITSNKRLNSIKQQIKNH